MFSHRGLFFLHRLRRGFPNCFSNFNITERTSPRVVRNNGTFEAVQVVAFEAPHFACPAFVHPRKSCIRFFSSETQTRKTMPTCQSCKEQSFSPAPSAPTQMYHNSNTSRFLQPSTLNLQPHPPPYPPPASDHYPPSQTPQPSPPPPAYALPPSTA